MCVRERERQKERKTDRETGKETSMQGDRLTEICIKLGQHFWDIQYLKLGFQLNPPGGHVGSFDREREKQ